MSCGARRIYFVCIKQSDLNILVERTDFIRLSGREVVDES